MRMTQGALSPAGRGAAGAPLCLEAAGAAGGASPAAGPGSSKALKGSSKGAGRGRANKAQKARTHLLPYARVGVQGHLHDGAAPHHHRPRGQLQPART